MAKNKTKKTYPRDILGKGFETKFLASCKREGLMRSGPSKPS